MRPVATSDSQTFRLSVLGYNRADVDQFLQRTAADRQRVDDGITVLEFLAAESPDGPAAAMSLALRESQQIWANAEVEARRLVQEAETEAEYLRQSYPGDLDRQGAIAAVVERWIGPLTIGRLTALAASAVVFALLLGVSAYQIVSGADAPATEHAVSVNGAAGSAASDRSGTQNSDTTPGSSAAAPLRLEGTDSPLPAEADRLVITLTALRLCWIRTTTDGGQPVEHLLHPTETISVQAESEAVLRIGDAAALSIQINDRMAQPLGGDGEVVTARITRSNYSSFLAP